MKVFRVWVAAVCACATVMGCNTAVVTTDDAARSDAGRDSSIPVVDGSVDGGSDGGSDPCTGRTLCETEGVSCDADSLVTCATDSDGCLVEVTLDCGLADDVCDATSGTAACVDPCSLIPAADRCTADARTCNSESLEICAADSNGCYVLARTDCAAMPGGVCDDSGTMAVCALPTDPCAGVADACTTAGTSCTGEVLTTCAPNAFGCLVATTDDCAARAGTCEDATAPAACMFTGDPCAAVTECAAAGTSCVGPELVTCATDAYGCLVETRTNCTSVSFGFCDAAGAPAMCATGATDPCMGMTECDPAGARTCADGDTIGLCAANALGCYVPTTMDCTTGDVCDAPTGEMATCVDACSLVETCTTATSCDGDTLVTCTPDTNGCLVETATTECLFSCGTTGTTSSCVDTVCPGSAPVVLNCDSGTFNGTTVGGTTLFGGPYGTCSTSTNYAGAEQVVRFRHAGTGRVAVNVTATRTAATGDFDLFVIDGGDGTAACNTLASACSDGSVGSTAVESVDFVGVAGQTSYLVYDIFNGATTTSDYTLAITCTPIVCGDGARGAGETCDDSNMVAGDGCSDTCVIETGFACTGTPSTCTRTCGNGIVGTGETCDDMDRDAGDGCSATCQTEAGYSCSGAPSTCVVIPPGGVCATAIAVNATIGLTGTTVGGGPPPTGSTCRGISSGAGPAFYYAVTIPAATRVDVQLTPSFDMVLHTLDACGAADCSASTDSAPERLTLTNSTAAPITRIVATNGYYAAGSGTYSISFTYMTSVCGNGIVEAGEACDDGGTVAGNGCSATCQVESGYRCTGAPSTCTALGPNPSCATAIDLGTGGSATGQALGGGGDRPTGTGCGSSAGPVLYYSVTVPPGSELTFTATPATAWDLTLRGIADCTATTCLSAVDAITTGAESLRFANPGAAPLTRVIAVGADSATTFGLFDVLATTAPLAYTAIPAACVTTGTFASLTRSSTSDDATTAIAPLPFTMTYFGSPVTHYSTSTNGFAQLWPTDTGTPVSTFSNGSLPGTGTPNGTVAAFWDDIYLGAAFDIRTQTVGVAGSQVFVIEWRDALAGSGGAPLTFQAHLYEGTNVIELHYCSVGTGDRATGNSATIGIENQTGTAAVQISYNTANAVTTGTAYRITP